MPSTWCCFPRRHYARSKQKQAVRAYAREPSRAKGDAVENGLALGTTARQPRAGQERHIILPQDARRSDGFDGELMRQRGVCRPGFTASTTRLTAHRRLSTTAASSRKRMPAKFSFCHRTSPGKLPRRLIVSTTLELMASCSSIRILARGESLQSFAPHHSTRHRFALRVDYHLQILQIY
jgi:hypothetical protein